MYYIQKIKMEEQYDYEKLKRRILINDLFILFFIGVILNMGVIIFNDSKMPVFFYEGEEVKDVPDYYVAFTDFKEVNYPYLSDIIKIKSLKFSIGDIIMFSSVIGIFFVFIKGEIIDFKERRLK